YRRSQRGQEKAEQVAGIALLDREPDAGQGDTYANHAAGSCQYRQTFVRFIVEMHQAVAEIVGKRLTFAKRRGVGEPGARIVYLFIKEFDQGLLATCDNAARDEQFAMTIRSIEVKLSVLLSLIFFVDQVDGATQQHVDDATDAEGVLVDTPATLVIALELGGGTAQLPVIQRWLERLVGIDTRIGLASSDQLEIRPALLLLFRTEYRRFLALSRCGIFRQFLGMQAFQSVLLLLGHVLTLHMAVKALLVDTTGITIDAPGRDQGLLALDHRLERAGLGLFLPGVESGNELWGEVELFKSRLPHFSPTLIFIKKLLRHLQRRTRSKGRAIHMVQRDLRQQLALTTKGLALIAWRIATTYIGVHTRIDVFPGVLAIGGRLCFITLSGGGLLSAANGVQREAGTLLMGGDKMHAALEKTTIFRQPSWHAGLHLTFVRQAHGAAGPIHMTGGERRAVSQPHGGHGIEQAQELNRNG